MNGPSLNNLVDVVLVVGADKDSGLVYRENRPFRTARKSQPGSLNIRNDHYDTGDHKHNMSVEEDDYTATDDSDILAEATDPKENFQAQVGTPRSFTHCITHRGS